MHPVQAIGFRTRRARHSLAELPRKATVAINLPFPDLPRKRGVWAVTMVRDEADVIGHAIDHLVGQGISHVLVVDHLSQDETAEISAKRGDVVSVVPYRHPAYNQGTIVTALARHAARSGAEWIVPFDADEMWYSDDGALLAEHLLSRSDDVAQGSWWNYLPTQADGAEMNPFQRMTWRNGTAQSQPKVAFRANEKITVGYGNHSVEPAQTVGTGLVVAHYPYRSRKQFLRKITEGAAATKAARLPKRFMSHWRELAALTPDDLQSLWERFVVTHELPFDGWNQHRELVHDPGAELLRFHDSERSL